MSNLQSFQSNKPTSFHVIALNIVYIAILTFCHFVFPYIHELVFSFFNGLFLLLSVLIFFYINAVLRTSSITYFSYSSLLFRVIFSILLLAFSMVFIAFITNTTEIIQKVDFMIFLIFVLVMNSGAMVFIKSIYHFIKPTQHSHIILITNVGDIRNHKIKQLLSDSDRTVMQYKVNEIDKLIDYAVEKKVEAVYIYIDPKNLNALEPIIQDLSMYAFEIYWVLPESIFSESHSAFSIQPVRLNALPVNLDTNQYLLKRTLDVVGALFLLSTLSPFIFIAGIIIKVSSRGPIFYSHLRIGQFGKEFKMLKFRSMIDGSDSSMKQVTDDDNRVTFIGKIMRKTSFDESPQLINVLKGEMTLVGPRPHILTDNDYYSEKILKFLTRHQVKPGLTGLAQITSRIKTNSIGLMQEKLQKDLEYINNWSLYLDIKILLLTPISLWKNRNSTH